MRENCATDTASHTDLALVVAAQTGDHDAYALLVARHAPRLLGLARRLLATNEDAEDAVQDTFLRAHRALGSFRGEAAFGTWLYRIAVNVCRDAAKARVRIEDQRIVLETEARFLDARYTVDAEQVVAAAAEREALEDALHSIPIAYRETVLLHDMEGFTMAEVAAITHTPLPTAKSRLRRGRMLLVDQLAGRPEPARPESEGVEW